MQQADKLMNDGVPPYHESIIRLEKICESCYTLVKYNMLERKCSKCEKADKEAAERKVRENKK
jgi:hypothetical protein